MATIAGTLTRPSGEPAAGIPIRAMLIDGPYDGGGVTRAASPEFFHTHPTTGAYSFTLAQGGYTIRIPGTPEFSIDVPAGSGTYSLDEVSGSPAPVYRGDYPVIDTLAEAQASVILGRRVDILSNGRGRPGTFVRDTNYSGPDDGVEGFYDDAGIGFRAIVRE